MWLVPVFLKLEGACMLSGHLANSAHSDSVGLVWGLIVCVSDKQPRDEVDVPGPWVSRCLVRPYVKPVSVVSREDWFLPFSGTSHNALRNTASVDTAF